MPQFMYKMDAGAGCLCGMMREAGDYNNVDGEWTVYG